MSSASILANKEDIALYQPLFDRWSGCGICTFRIMPDGSLAGVLRQLSTWGICSKLDWDCFDRRWCYESRMDAEYALSLWSGIGAPPGPWLKTFHPERHNPLMFRQHENNPYIWNRIPADELDMGAIWPS